MKHDSPDGGLTDYELEEIVSEPPPAPRRRRRCCHRFGGGSLAVSVLVHAAFVIVALLIIWRTTLPVNSWPENFNPGGPKGAAAHEKRILKKQHAVSHAQPVRRLSALSRSDYHLAKTDPLVSTLPALTALAVSGGAGSIGGSGAGGLCGGVRQGHGGGRGP